MISICLCVCVTVSSSGHLRRWNVIPADDVQSQHRALCLSGRLGMGWTTPIARTSNHCSCRSSRAFCLMEIRVLTTTNSSFFFLLATAWRGTRCCYATTVNLITLQSFSRVLKSTGQSETDSSWSNFRICDMYVQLYTDIWIVHCS